MAIKKIGLSILAVAACIGTSIAQTSTINNQLFKQTSVVKYTINNTVFYPGFIKVNSTLNQTDLTKLGIEIGTKAGTIWTIRVPQDALKLVPEIKGIEAMELDAPLSANMDMANKYSRVDSVHNGVNLPQQYSGKGVVVGIIDAGFDYMHPAFWDTTGMHLRLKRVWEQHKTGTPPTGYTYGNELKDSVSFIQAQNDVAAFSHGTHVGGIAAGSGVGSTSNNKLRGVAYEADLVFVGIKPAKNEWKTAGMSSIVDAVNYIFSYAQSVGKPAVVNLSWGCSIGPNDGTSLFAQALDNLTGPGKIFVLSAGNNGDENIHLTKANAADTLVQSFVTFPTINNEKRTWIDVWGTSDTNICVQLSLFGAGVRGSTSSWICSSVATNFDTFLLGLGGDTLLFQATSKLEANGKAHILIDAFSKTSNTLCFAVNTPGKFHAWLGYVNDYSGYYGAFTKSGQAWATNGNADYTLGEMASTKSAITVAAHVSKISFKNLANANQSYAGYATFGQLAPFSSHGPTADERNKPDIAAPGMTIASAVNSYDVSYAAGGGNYAQSVVKYTSPYNNRDYYYGEASGTSMSSPMASGIVALLLQINPNLSPSDIKTILKETAIKDNYTTQNPNPFTWGVGKINAYGAVKSALKTVGINNVALAKNSTITVFPNPTKGICTVNYLSDKTGAAKLEIINTLGQVVFVQELANVVGENQIQLSTTELKNGLYWISVTHNNQKQLTKLVVQ